MYAELNACMRKRLGASMRILGASMRKRLGASMRMLGASMRMLGACLWSGWVHSPLGYRGHCLPSMWR